MTTLNRTERAPLGYTKINAITVADYSNARGEYFK